jgi:hypothetical protein
LSYLILTVISVLTEYTVSIILKADELHVSMSERWTAISIFSNRSISKSALFADSTGQSHVRLIGMTVTSLPISQNALGEYSQKRLSAVMVEGIKSNETSLSPVGMDWLMAPFPVTIAQRDNRNFL